jgi:hypothetical protein
MPVNLWPVGYSIFIHLIHQISSSHYFLVSCQCMLLEIALLYFFYSVLYLLKINRTSTIWLFIFLFLNPIFPYLANCILSDTLFFAVSITLFTQYLWMYHTPSTFNIFIQGLLIALAFTIRYAAIYYPIVSIVAILLSGYKPVLKLIGVIFPWVMIIPFIFYTKQKTKEITGTSEFSVFGGWQIANNALYMYGNIHVDTTDLPDGTKELDKAAKKYFAEKHPTEEDFLFVPGTFFIKVPDAILKPYMRSHVDTATSLFQAWGKVSPVYKKYGTYLIKTHPLAFIRYYMWLNTRNYFNPYLEKFGNYNLGSDHVWKPAEIWFEMKDNVVRKIPDTKYQTMIFSIYPYFFLILNVYYLFCFFYLLFTGRYKIYRSNASIIMATAFLIINFGFSVFATPVVLRHEIIPMIVLFVFCLYMSELMSEEKKVV